MAKKQKLNIQAIEGRRAANTPSGDKNTAIELERYQNAVTGALDILVPAINIMKEDIIAVTGAIYGNKTINEATKFTQLLGNMSNVDLLQTPLKGLMIGFGDWIKNSDKLLTSTNKILKDIPKNFITLLDEYYKNQPESEVEVKNITTEKPEQVEAVPVDNSAQFTEITEYLKSINSILSPTIQDAIIANNQTTLLEGISNLLSDDIYNLLISTPYLEVINDLDTNVSNGLSTLNETISNKTFDNTNIIETLNGITTAINDKTFDTTEIIQHIDNLNRTDTDNTIDFSSIIDVINNTNESFNQKIDELSTNITSLQNKDTAKSESVTETINITPIIESVNNANTDIVAKLNDLSTNISSKKFEGISSSAFNSYTDFITESIDNFDNFHTSLIESIDSVETVLSNVTSGNTKGFNDINDWLSVIHENTKPYETQRALGKIDIAITGINTKGIESLLKLADYEFTDKNFGKFDIEAFVKGMKELEGLKNLNNLKLDIFSNEELLNQFSSFNSFVNAITGKGKINKIKGLFGDSPKIDAETIKEAAAVLKSMDELKNIGDFKWVDNIKVMVKNLDEFSVAMKQFDLKKFGEAISIMPNVVKVIDDAKIGDIQGNSLTGFDNFSKIQDALITTNTKFKEMVPSSLWMQIFWDTHAEAIEDLYDLISGKHGIIETKEWIDTYNWGIEGVESFNKFMDSFVELQQKFGVAAIYSFMLTGKGGGLKYINQLLTEINDKNNGLISTITSIPDVKEADQKIKEINELNKNLSEMAKGLASIAIISLPAMLGAWGMKNVANQIGDAIWYLNWIKNIDQAKTNLEQIKGVVDAFSDVAKPLAIVGLLALPAMLGVGGMWLISKMLPSVVEVILSISVKDVSEVSETIHKVSDVVWDMAKLTTGLAIMSVLAIPAIVGIGAMWIIGKLLGTVVNIINGINVGDVKTSIDNINQIKDVVWSMTKLSLGLAVMSVVGIPAILGLGMMWIELKLMTSVVGLLNDMPVANIKTATDSMNEINSFIMKTALTGLVLGLYTVVAVPAILGLGLLYIQIKLMSFVVDAINGIEFKKIENAKDVMAGFGILLGVCALTMLLGALTGAFVISHIGEILGFTVSLGIFMLITLGVINMTCSDEALAKTMAQAAGFAKLLLVCTGLMFLGALTGGWVFKHLPQILGFAIALGLFMMMVIGAYGLVSHLVKDTIKDAKGVAMLILVSAGVMIIGALFMMIPGLWLNAMMFGLALGAFILLVVGAYALVSLFAKDTIKEADKIQKLIIVSAIVMMLGAAFMYIPGLWLNALLFTLVLGAFILLTVGAYTLASKLCDNALKEAVKVAILIVVSAAVLMLGAWFMMDKDRALAALEFAALLAGFIFAVTWSINSNATNIEKAFLPLIGMAILVLVSGAILLYAGSKIAEDADIFWGSLGFAAVLSAFLFAMANIVKFAGNIDKKVLIQGELVLAGIVVITGLACGAMYILAEAMAKVNGDWQSLLIGAGIMSGIILVFGGMVAAIAAIMATGIGGLAIAAAEAALAGIVGIVGLAAAAMYTLASAMKIMSEVKDFDASKITNVITGTMEIAGSLVPLANPLILMTVEAAAEAGDAISRLISKMSKAVQEYASLTVPEYDSNGKIIGYRKLNQNDFKEAGDNVSLIVSTLGNALMKTFGEHKDWFEDKSLFGSVFGGRSSATPFGLMIGSLTGMSDLVSTMAEAVATYAKLQVPMTDPKTGQIIKGKYRALDKSDFQAAADNIGLIITTLGSSLIETFEENKDWFTDDSWWHTDATKTPFGMMITALGGMSKMVAEYADVTAKMATLQVPLTDENGNIIKDKYRTLKQEDFKKAAVNTKTIIEALAKDLMAVYEPHQDDWFDEGWFSDSPFQKMKDSLGGMGSIVSDAYDAVKDIAEGRIACEWDDKGNATKWKSITEVDLTENGEVAKTINSVMTLIPKVMMKIIADKDMAAFFNKDNVNGIDIDYLKDGYELIKEIMGYVSDVNKIVMDIAQLKIATGYDNDGKAIGYQQIDAAMFKESGKIYEVIDAIMGCIPRIFMKQMDNSDFAKFIGDEDLQKKLKEGFDNIKDTLEYVTDTFTSVLKGLEKFADKEGNYTEKLEAVKTAIDTMSTTFVDTVTKINNTTFPDLTTFVSSTELFEKAFDNLISLDSKLVEIKFEGMSKFGPVAKEYLNGCTVMAEAYKVLAEVGDFNFGLNTDDKLVKSLKGVQGVVNSLTNENLTNFHTHVEDLSEYTKTVNSIDLAKTNALTKLTDSLNELAGNMGNLDGLTEAVANKLSGVLEKLTAELNNTKETFKTAERIQKERYDYISKTIKQVEDTMSKPLTVKVGLENPETPANTDQQQQQQSGGTPSTPSNPTEQSDNVSNAGDMAPGTSVQNPVNNGASNNENKKENPKPQTNNNPSYQQPVVTQQSNVNYENINSKMASTVRSVFKEMIIKYNLAGGGAKGNAKRS